MTASDRPAGRPRVLFSICWSAAYWPEPGDGDGCDGDGCDVVVRRRPSDWGVTGVRRLIRVIADAVRTARAARGFDALVVCTGSLDVRLIAALKPVFYRRTRLVLFDFLIPRRKGFTGLALRRADAVACIRRGDVDYMVDAFGVSRVRLAFVPFPATDEPMAGTDGEAEPYVYAGGSAHRDWPTLVRAIRACGCRAIISCDAAIDAADYPALTVLPHQSPADGRRLMAAASVVVVPLADTHLPAGPLVLLDAMAAGKAVVATDVNGTRDYVTAATAAVVPPGDADAMATAISRLLRDPGLRRTLGRAAADRARAEFTAAGTTRQLLGLCVPRLPKPKGHR